MKRPVQCSWLTPHGGGIKFLRASSLVIGLIASTVGGHQHDKAAMIQQLNHAAQTENLHVNLNININLQGAEGITEGLMQLLTRATLSAQAEPLEVSQSAPSETLCQPVAPQSPPSEQSAGFLAEYQVRLKPKKQRTAGKKAVKDHETSMRQFDEFLASKSYHRCAEPVVTLLESQPDLLVEFARDRFRSHENSAITVNRRLTHIGMVAKSCGVVIEKIPLGELKRLRREIVADNPVDNRRIPSFDEIDRLACHVVYTTFPYGAHSPYFWRGWIRMLALFGPRSRDVVSTLPEKSGLRKQDVIFETLCPIADVNNALGRELHSPYGWLWYFVHKDHHSDSPRVLFPMPKWLRDWVTFFCELSDDDVRVFPSTQKSAAALSQKSLSAQWNLIRERAAVDSRIMPSEGKGQKIALRKYAANWWKINVQKLGDTKLAEDVSYYVLHHAEATTATRHYLSVQAAALPTMLDLLDGFPVPAASAAAVSLLPE